MHYKVHFFQFGVDQEISFRKQQSGFRNQSIKKKPVQTYKERMQPMRSLEASRFFPLKTKDNPN